MRNRWTADLSLVAVLAAFRLLGAAFSEQLPNIQPLPAMLLCGLVFLKRSRALVVTGLAWLLTDPLVSLLQHRDIFGWHHLELAAGLATTFVIARSLREKATPLGVMAGAALSALSFYAVTNAISFVVDPLYAKSWQGFVQAQWTGPTGYMPTWVFLRNLIAANVLFTAAFLLTRPQPESEISAAPAVIR
jgi:hypothetical protein